MSQADAHSDEFRQVPLAADTSWTPRRNLDKFSIDQLAQSRVRLTNQQMDMIQTGFREWADGASIPNYVIESVYTRHARTTIAQMDGEGLTADVRAQLVDHMTGQLLGGEARSLPEADRLTGIAEVVRRDFSDHANPPAGWVSRAGDTQVLPRGYRSGLDAASDRSLYQKFKDQLRRPGHGQPRESDDLGGSRIRDDGPRREPPAAGLRM